ncbi:acyl-CoA thioesterase [Salinispora oceanensis]|uniref:acyl-CoA thioesterase n=1 Tax=Salinispora oceanensis TaxID=1050199 RepID=UPI0003787DD5|nr:thioesterase family protein [Salinispora oceanensis]
MTASVEFSVDHGHVELLPIHFDDLDSMGLVHNCRYGVLVERALNTFWTSRGWTFDGGTYSHPDVFLAVAEFAISYRMPFRGTGAMAVHLWIDQFSGSSAGYGFRCLSRDGQTVHAEGRRVHVRIDPKTLRPTAWADDTRSVMTGIARPS